MREPTYAELVDRLQAIVRWLDAANRSLTNYRPGSAGGRTLAQTIQRANAEHDRIRRLIRSHPDSPPAG